MSSFEEMLEGVVQRVIRAELQRVRDVAPANGSNDERVSLTVAAAKSGYGPATIRKWAAIGLIKEYGHGRKKMFSLAEVLAVKEEGEEVDVDSRAAELVRGVR
jgi:hypothetical protein